VLNICPSIDFNSHLISPRFDLYRSCSPVRLRRNRISRPLKIDRTIDRPARSARRHVSPPQEIRRRVNMFFEHWALSQAPFVRSFGAGRHFVFSRRPRMESRLAQMGPLRVPGGPLSMTRGLLSDRYSNGVPCESIETAIHDAVRSGVFRRF